MRSIRGHLRLAVLVAVVLLLAGAVAVLAGTGGRGVLGTADTSPGGARAVATLLRDHGVSVRSADSASAAGQALGALPPAARASATVFVTSGSLARTRLSTLWATGVGHVVLVDPPAGALSLLTGRVTAGLPVAPATVGPACGLPAARRAGALAVSGSGFLARPVPFVDPALLRAGDRVATLTACYPDGDRAWLVRRVAGGRTLDVIGSADFVTNGRLAADGDAALALDLLGTGSTLVWYRPDSGDAVDPGAPGGGSLVTLVPPAVWALVTGLAGAALALALARARRLGPVVAETLPVVVRASETARGRARLYRRGRARGAALGALTEAAVVDLAARLGLARTARPADVVSAVAARTRRPPAEIARVLGLPGPPTDPARSGPPAHPGQPADDAQLIAAARALRGLYEGLR